MPRVSVELWPRGVGGRRRVIARTAIGNFGSVGRRHRHAAALWHDRDPETILEASVVHAQSAGVWALPGAVIAAAEHEPAVDDTRLEPAVRDVLRRALRRSP